MLEVTHEIRIMFLVWQGDTWLELKLQSNFTENVQNKYSIYI